VNLDRIGAAAASRTYQIRCRSIGRLLPEYIGSSTPLPESIATHLSSCLVCRSEADRLRQIAEVLEEGRRHSWTPPASLVDAVMGRLDDPYKSRSWGRLAVAAGLAIGVGVALAVVGSRRNPLILRSDLDG